MKLDLSRANMIDSIHEQWWKQISFFFFNEFPQFILIFNNYSGVFWVNIFLFFSNFSKFAEPGEPGTPGYDGYPGLPGLRGTKGAPGDYGDDGQRGSIHIYSTSFQIILLF